jgi:hypothetical protein
LGESPEGEQYDPELYSEEYMEAHEIDPDQLAGDKDHPVETEEYMGDYPNDDEPEEEEYSPHNDERLVSSYASVIIPLDPQYEAHANAAVAQPEQLPTVYRTRASRKSFPGEQPERNFDKPLSLSGYISINGFKAHVLMDTGCTTDMVSPDYLTAMGELPFELESPVGLQMATRGSRSRINYGYRAKLAIGKFNAEHYVDVANLDQYDIILGSGFMRKHKVVIDFREEKRAAFVINGERHVENMGDFGSPEGGKKLKQLYRPVVADKTKKFNTATAVIKSVDTDNKNNTPAGGKSGSAPTNKAKPPPTRLRKPQRNAVAGPSKGPKPK